MTQEAIDHAMRQMPYWTDEARMKHPKLFELMAACTYHAKGTPVAIKANLQKPQSALDLRQRADRQRSMEMTLERIEDDGRDEA